jgi:hypothetical protein
MNCSAFDALAGDLVRDRLPVGRERDATLEHAEACTRCGLRLVDERALAADLRALALGTERAEAPERVEQALLAAWREGGIEPMTAAAPRFPSGRPPWLWGTAAAVLLSAGVAVLGRPVRPAPSAATPSPGTADPAPGDVAAEVRRAPDTTGATPSAPTRSLRAAPTPAASPAAPSVDDGMTAGFASLDGTYGLEDLESAHVVRVQLSSAALAALGWPVADDGETRLVSADVVVAEDGIARAIRLVQ